MDAKLSIEDTLTVDHERIDKIYDNLMQLLKSNSEKSKNEFDNLKRSLDKHINWEEKELFPAVLSVFPKSKKHIESLLIDHERIHKMLQSISDKIEIYNFQEAAKDMTMLKIFLLGHNQDEEFGVYKDADKYLSPERQKQLLSLFIKNR